MGDDDVKICFTHWKRLEQKERPLSPIRDSLKHDNAYIESDKSCYDESCNGTLWEGDEEAICEKCSAVYGSIHSSSTHISQDSHWVTYWEHRPHYHKSGRARLVGSFDHDWIDSADTDGPISEIDPESFYRS